MPSIPTGASSGQEAAYFGIGDATVGNSCPAIGGDGTIFFGTANGIFYAISPDGSLRFKVSAGGRIAGSPAIYFTADDGYLYAIN